jgi:hypothetical protein
LEVFLCTIWTLSGYRFNATRSAGSCKTGEQEGCVQRQIAEICVWASATEPEDAKSVGCSLSVQLDSNGMLHVGDAIMSYVQYIPVEQQSCTSTSAQGCTPCLHCGMPACTAPDGSWRRSFNADAGPTHQRRYIEKSTKVCPVLC